MILYQSKIFVDISCHTATMQRFYLNQPNNFLLIPYRQPVESNSSHYPWLGEGLTKWVGDGKLLDTKKNIQLSLGNNLPLSNDMTFILVFSM